MEAVALIVILIVLGVFIVLRQRREEKRRRAELARSLREAYGGIPAKTYPQERYSRIGAYYRRHAAASCPIDDITWNDLGMDDLFRRMDYTHSAAGEEYLYACLRTPSGDAGRLAHLDETASWFDAHEEARVQAQLLMTDLGYTGKYSLYEYLDLLDTLGERSNRRHIAALAILGLFAVLLPFQSGIAILGLAVCAASQIVLYFREKREIEPYIVSFRYVLRLADTCEALCRLDIPPLTQEWESARADTAHLSGMRRGSYWVFSSQYAGTGGNPLDIIADYLCMIFHTDLIAFNKMLKKVRAHLPEIDRLIGTAGYVEAAISVASFRASLSNGWCVPQLTADTEARLLMREAYHPLLAYPIKNSIDTDRGLLITGSNASGKSTFLKMTAVNAILAQTICTCAAERYEAPCFRILTSMALRDDLTGGESYYIVEIRSLKRILDAISAADTPVLCCVDEVLRGTNTVERIAASAEILRSLGTAGGSCLCLAATHDLELAPLLGDFYADYHFAEEFRDGDILFPYRLLPGVSDTRNAIRLLELMGYPANATAAAEERARKFLDTGVWGP